MELTKIDSKTGIVFEITDSFVDYGIDGNPENVKLNVEYSGNEDENGNSVLEFEWISVPEEANPHLTVDQIGQIEKVLENGKELDYVKSLKAFYEITGINFDANEYNYALNNNL